MNKRVIKELGEPLIYEDGDIWYVWENGFGCKNRERLKFLYVDPEFRGFGLGKTILKDLQKGSESLFTICPISTLGFYEKQGFKPVKTFKNWVHIRKNIENA